MDSVAGHLDAEVSEQRLESDSAQRAAAVRLDRLAAELRRAPLRRAPPSGLRARLAQRWSAKDAQVPQPCGIYLWGGVGRGKTHLLNLFYESLPFAERERSHFHQFMRTVHLELKTLDRSGEPLERLAALLAKRARVICLDEFFVADIGDAMILAGLLQGLFARRVTLVATSNLPPHELYRDGLQRQRFLPAIALLERHMEIVHLDGGTDYRLRHLERAGTYRDSGAADADADLRGLFHRLVQMPVTGPTTLIINGRPLGALDSARNAAWFEFRELCEAAHGANDYLELARNYAAIFLSNVPILDHDSDDAARRFVTLIDALYDRNVLVVIAAAAAPADLYRGERLRFEFQRTASRLIEMQTQRYLARAHRA
jgi:cell division protein ZapE